MQRPNSIQAIFTQSAIRRAVPISLVAVLGLTGVCLVEQAIVPTAVQAYTSRVEVTLDVQPGESYDALIRRAEVVARAAAQRSFDRDILITDVLIMVTAQNEASVAPILSLEATRTQWRSIPDAHRWATYYRSSKNLLGLDGAPSSTATAPTSPTITPSAPISPPTTIAPNSIPGRPSTPLPPTPNQQFPNGTSPGSPSNEIPGSPQPGRTPILPDRILTPGGIGK